MPSRAKTTTSVRVGRHAHPREAEPPVDEHREADDDRAAGGDPADHRDHVVGARRRLRPPRSTTAARGGRARGRRSRPARRGGRSMLAEAQHPALEQLRRAGSPPVLVGAVAPPVPDGERPPAPRRAGRRRGARRHGSWTAADQRPRHADPSASPITSGGAKGSRPTSSVGGPARRGGVILPSSPRGEPGQSPATRVEQPARRGSRRGAGWRGSARSRRDARRAAPVPASGARAANSSISGRIVGKLASAELEPGGLRRPASAAASPCRAGGGRRAGGR